MQELYGILDHDLWGKKEREIGLFAIELDVIKVQL